MGQYANQPDFATRAVSITKSDNITPDKFLDGAAIFVGAKGNLNVIMAGTVGATTVVDLVSPLYSGSNGENYTTAAAVLTQGGSTGSSGLKVDIVADASGVITSITINDPGTGYQNGDLISPIQGGNVSAVFKVVTENGKPAVADGVLFSNIGDASFVPVIVDYVLDTDTSCGKLVAVY